jgi:hypothetical protein
VKHHLPPFEAFTDSSCMAGGEAINGHDKHGEQFQHGNEVGTNDLQDSPALSSEDIVADLEQVLDSSVQHFFVTVDSSNLAVAEEAAGLDLGVSNPDSITQFLTLPRITARDTRVRRFHDPILDFSIHQCL